MRFELTTRAGIQSESSGGWHPRQGDVAENVRAVNDHGEVSSAIHDNRDRHPAIRVPCGRHPDTGDVHVAVANLHSRGIGRAAGRIWDETIVIHAEAEPTAASV